MVLSKKIFGTKFVRRDCQIEYCIYDVYELLCFRSLSIRNDRVTCYVTQQEKMSICNIYIQRR